MKKGLVFGTCLALAILTAAPAMAHYGMIIPSDCMVMQGDDKTIRLTLSFSHPFEQIGMVLDKPKVFGVATVGKTSDLTGTLQKTTVMNQPAWTASYAVKRPGIHAFYMEPQPYWEPSEDCYIIHYTKTVVAAFGDDEGWDEPVGLKTEIFSTQSQFLTRILAKASQANSLGEWSPARSRQFQTLTHPEHLGRAFRVLVQSRV